MKFSWTFLNYLIDLQYIKFEDFQSTLILNGFEIENIEKDNNSQDVIIDLNITSNRKDVLHYIGLAIEVSTIFNIPLIAPLNQYSFLYNKINHCNHYVLLNQLTHIQPDNFKSPKWLNHYLLIHINNFDKIDLFSKIQQYIKIKWGYIINFINPLSITNNQTKPTYQSVLEEIEKLTIITRYSNKHKNILTYTQLHNTAYNNIIYLIFSSYNLQFNNPIYFLSAYHETIKLITTFSKCIINKTHHYKINKKSLRLNTIHLNHKYINNILGPIINNPFIYLTKNQILEILEQLNLQPKYKQQRFSLQIPPHRASDLQRNIDIIEEIGRIYSFQSFTDKLKSTNIKGRKSYQTLIVNKIRNILHYLGLHEVINSTLITKHKSPNTTDTISLINPITMDQKQLRYNLIDNLLKNFMYNTKNNFHTIEIFEIGKIFHKTYNKLQEKLHVGGIIYNQSFNRFTWQDKPISIQWFHARGILEYLFKILEARITWRQIEPTAYKGLQNLSKYLSRDRILGIYNLKNNALIGILGELNYNKYKDKNINNVYIFELNIIQLIKSIQNHNHLQYIVEPYSRYPCVTRDISITLNTKYNLEYIKQLLRKKNPQWIESISIQNIYYNKINNIHSLCLRITYRAYDRTLNNLDLQQINHNIDNIIQQLKQ